MLRHLLRDPYASNLAHFRVRDRHGSADYPLRSWPQPRCFRRAFGDSEWFEMNPPLLAWKALLARGLERLLDAAPAQRRWSRKPSPGQGALAFDAPASHAKGGLAGFWESVPSFVREPIQQLTAGEWPVVEFAAADGSTAELVQSNLALAVALTMPEYFLGRPVVGRRRLQIDLARRRQHEALGELGFPSQRGVRRILQRIRPEALSVRALQELRWALRNGARTLPIGHLRQLNAGTLALLCVEAVHPHLATRVLHEVSESESELSEAQTAYQLRDCRWMLRELGRSANGFKPNSMAAIRASHDELVHELAQRQQQAREREIALPDFEEYPEAHGFTPEMRFEPPREPAPQRRQQAVLPRRRTVEKNAVFPAPPIPDGGEKFGLHIRALRTQKELSEWATAQQNCAASYARRVLARTYYLYAVLRPEPATLGIYYSPSSGRWQLEQLKGPRNRRVHKATRAGVRAWLDASNS